ncbi:kinase-like protein [Delitschia confertaspora ATCC 74209]|uniref:non-specific serine/threonine protein kinase n=1 Tax=Delitschia confertaspora ATCC 74209 TaxID=1513339 RepID=A0A9P4N2C2_9PLEO|nr:kinase-like protein [Delitschia confertaspora ATCC 74209]
MKMEPTRLQPPSSMGTKSRAIQQAKEQENLVAERAKRSGDEPPPYDFFELIGKGSYGRVFKGKSRTTNSLVAIKIIDIDKVDYEEMTTKNLSETLREISILQQLRDSKARPYVNIIEEARTVHNELWIISEYASGGSVHTLMKPTMSLQNPGLEEKYIIPIARELALGLQFVHDAGVLHRDLKCNNILILEDGRVQLCDFGVSGTLEPDASKRSTIVGTPYWMAPELQKEWVKEADPGSMMRANGILYGSEVDIWAYGCTIYEMATGFPPFHRTAQFKLPETGVPHLEGDRFSDTLKDFIAYVLQPSPQDRPTAQKISEHPFVADTNKMYPTVILVQLVERYYRWEQGGGARASLFNPYGAQAPDPLGPEAEDEDDDWTFSTTDEFENKFVDQFTGQFTDPFIDSMNDQVLNGLSAPHLEVTEDRFAKLQAAFMEESVQRGKRRLNKLFDTSATPYRYSGLDSDRPPSDLALREFNNGAPNRETVIDLDFAAPTSVDVPTIDLGEVSTLKANRINSRLIREFELEEEESASFDQDQTARRATQDWTFPTASVTDRRATRDWTFPTMPEPDEPTLTDQDQLTRRATREWKFPSTSSMSDKTEKPNRRTVEWTFDTAMAEANYEPLPSDSDAQISRRRMTNEPPLPTMTAPLEQNRQTRDFVFPPPKGSIDIGASFASSPTLEPGFIPTLRHATTEPIHAFSDYPPTDSSPDSPLRASMIDLDMANIDDYRPSTADSVAASTYTVGSQFTSGNPFDLEDQMRLSQSNDRSSYHMKSQSEPNHAIPGLLTPNPDDAQGYDPEHILHEAALHARGISEQVRAGRHPSNNAGHFRKHTQQVWDGWNHAAAYNMEYSSPASASTTTSTDEDESVDALWDRFERQINLHQSDNTYQDSYGDLRRPSLSVGPNGKPIVDFPVPRGPDPEALLLDGDQVVLSNGIWRAATELKDGIRACRDLLGAMKLGGMERVEEEEGVHR